jgi:hypothetical protein
VKVELRRVYSSKGRPVASIILSEASIPLPFKRDRVYFRMISPTMSSSGIQPREDVGDKCFRKFGEIVARLDDLFGSDTPIMIFPSGEVSRRKNRFISDRSGRKPCYKSGSIKGYNSCSYKWQNSTLSTNSENDWELKCSSNLPFFRANVKQEIQQSL